MRRVMITTLFALAIVACAKEGPANRPAASKETSYPMTATIVSRDAAKNTVTLDNEEVPGRMAAMTMEYELRGARVSDLPADRTPVEVTLHDANGSYYVTDVKPKK